MTCKNCETALQPEASFCYECGGKVIRNRLTLKNLMIHLGETFFNFDNKLLLTFIDLFKKPETVIGGYINGVRNRHVSPINYLGLSITFGGLYLIVLNKYFPNALSGMYSGGTGGQEIIMNNTLSIIQNYYSLINILFIPFYALISRLVFINRKDFNYTEHVVMSMYIMAHVSLLTSFTSIVLLALKLPADLLSTGSLLFQMAFFAYCYKQLYKLSIGGIILRSLFFLGILLAFLLISIITGIIIGIFFKDSEFMQNLIEAQKASQELKKTRIDTLQ